MGIARGALPSPRHGESPDRLRAGAWGIIAVPE
jgi:hypothetical protein